MSFYSKLVRLKVSEYLSSLYTQNQFLFQTGAIKSLILYTIKDVEQCLSFYSKLVRLKGSKSMKGLFVFIGFYSKLVRLKEDDCFIQTFGEGSFYSKLVRLKAIIEFLSVSSIRVSIPNWCD